MGLFKKKDKKIEVDINQYEVLLCQTILICSEDFPTLCEDLNIEDANMMDYFVYMTYLLYISNILLKSKYESSFIDSITINTIEKLIIFAEIEGKEKDALFSTLKETYDSISKLNIDLMNQNDILKLVKYFQYYLELGYDSVAQSHIMLRFTSFIRFHSVDILNDKIVIKEMK